MADAVPISDVLCEAMEYLSKLGSNLRVRSDSLKEKRIRKDKLKNVHAVQKAANKVLLICQLSKKSLENVETGVKKVLKQIDLSQDPTTSDGGNSIYKSSKNNKVISYDYIEYDSRRLRIRKKVDMKHYTSVKVIARKMPISMQDKYPVFLNCKLYRSRNVKFIELDKNISDDVQNNSPKHSDTDQHEDIECSNDNIIDKSENEPMEGDIVDESKLQSKMSLSKHLKRKSEKDIAQSDNDQTVSDKEDSLKGHESSPHPQSDLSVSEEKRKSNNIEDQATQPNKKPVSDTVQEIQDTRINAEDASEKDHENQTKKNFNKKSQKPKEKHPSSKSKEISKDTKNRPSTKIYKSEKSKKFRHIKIINDSSDSDENKPSSEVNTEEKNPVRDSKDSDENKTDKTESFQEKEGIIDISKETINSTQDKNTDNKNLKDSTNKEQIETCVDIVELNDSSNEETNTKNNKNKSGEESVNEAESEKLYCKKDQDTKDEKHSSNTAIKEESNKKDTIEHDNDNDSKPRPFLRCVSLDKLIKKNVEIPKIKIDESEKDSQTKSKNKMFSTKYEKSAIKHNDKKRRKLYKASNSSESSKENEEEYWIQKRKEVKKFKPKNFVINVKRLPELSEKYLCDQNLKRITQNGSVVCEVVQKLNEKDENHLEKSDIPDVNIAKNALLCDSDSDKSKDLVDTPRKVKRALLQDSGSEKEEHPPSPGPKSDKRNSENEKRNSASNEEDRNNKTPEPENKLSDKNDELKPSLLHDSTDETHKTPSKKITKNITTPPSKRKHIMESMHAKKMLLTYSSSSDTEDEQLRNVLKEIRDSLLKENPGDESKEQEIQKNVKLSSDSDESSVKAKKMKMCDTSKESLSVNETNSRKESVSEDASSAKDTNSQIDENTGKNSNSSLQKVRRK